MPARMKLRPVPHASEQAGGIGGSMSVIALAADDWAAAMPTSRSTPSRSGQLARTSAASSGYAEQHGDATQAPPLVAAQADSTPLQSDPRRTWK